MLTINEINSKIQKNVLNGTKIPHSTSYPVLYFENGKYYFAAFIFFYSREDIETGEIIKERLTKDKDFTNAPYDVKYNIHADASYDTSKEYYDKAFTILDLCRSKIIENGRFYLKEYRFYLDKIIANIPKEYQRFYYDLSV